jgi:proteasome lid subunit RPN8/RPN11
MEPRELTAALAQTPQERLLGVFHSHPHSAPEPSLIDLQTSWYTLPSYWIVSLQNFANPSLRVYKLQRTATPDGGSAAHTARLTYRLCELSFLP